MMKALQGWRRFLLMSLVLYTLLVAVGLGWIGGRILARVTYISTSVTLIADKPAVPSRVLDVNNNLITEFGSENRALVNLVDLPRSLVYALLVREDSTFFRHQGFSITGTGRAFIYVLLNKFFATGTAGGGSTLTQQLAGRLWSDRRIISYKRKLVELWWAIQFEHNLSKEQIIEHYINLQYFGDRSYGVETASQFFFNQPARYNSVAESAVLMIQLARPNGDYSPLRHPEAAKWRQRLVLDEVVDAGYMSADEVDAAFNRYWGSMDATRLVTKEVDNLDLAPFFSEYVRKILEERLYGVSDVYRDGYTIYTTLDLGRQKLAELVVAEEMKRIDETYQQLAGNIFTVLEEEELPFLRQLRMLWNFDGLDLNQGQQRRRARQTFQDELAPTLEALGLALGLDGLLPVLGMSSRRLQAFYSQNLPEVAFVSMNNENGYIEAMVGGREYKANQANQFNRVTDADLLPGSAFKPLYYAAAIREQVLTQATELEDLPYRFQNPDGSYYIPENYSGKYRGRIPARQALALSLNIPAIHVLERVGFDAAIDLSSRLLGYEEPRTVGRLFPHFYPLALGITSVSPYRLLRAYGTFANGGVVRNPLAIRYVEDRSGRLILNFEEEAFSDAARSSSQLLSEAEAYIMIDMLQETVFSGTFFNIKRAYAPDWRQPLAAKSGTSQNWADAWGVLLTPYQTSIAWVGFDQRGNSLGERLYGARAAGPMVMRYAKSSHKDLPIKPFTLPDEGLVMRTVERMSGRLWRRGCGGARNEYFLPGTEPREFCLPGDNQTSDAGAEFDLEFSRDAILDEILGGLDDPQARDDLRRSFSQSQ